MTAAIVRPKWILASTIVWGALVTMGPQIWAALEMPIPEWFVMLTGIGGPLFIIMERVYGVVSQTAGHPPLVFTPPPAHK